MRERTWRSWPPLVRTLARVSGIAAAVAAGIGLVTATALEVAVRQMPPAPLAMVEAVSTTVLDRNGRLLRAFTMAEGRWRLPVEAGEVDARYLAMLLAFEDRRFQSHSGVDPLAFARASWQLVRHRRIVSGGSTLTMQVARLLDGEHDRAYATKLRQIVRAVQLERQLSKAQILRLYLRLAPFGGNVEGVRAAAIAYFGKEPRRLSAGEAALLVALPQAPEARRPDRAAEAARRGRDRVLDRAVAAGVITQAEATRARLERVRAVRYEFPKLAPHLAESEVAGDRPRTVHRLTLEAGLQGQLEVLARDATHATGLSLSAAIVVTDHATGEVLAHVGSADYFDATRKGAIDMARAVRSPGSTLKPFIYGLGFEAGLIHPETLIEDRPVRFGTYAPKNFDEDFHGTVSIRNALAQSLNIPAVKVLNAVGPGRLAGRLRRAGVVPVLPAAQVEPTLAIALGGAGFRLVDLVALYAGVARGGDAIGLRHVQDGYSAGRGTNRRPLLSPVASWYITDILKDAPPPASAKAGSIAYKTGTSYGYRDAWAIGYDGRHTVGVWIGRADGAATPGLSGRVSAAPILFDAFARIGPVRSPLAAPPPGAVRTSGAQLPPPLKRFAEADGDREQGPFLEPSVAISFPPDRSELELDTDEPVLMLKVDGGALPLTWLADGAPIDLDGTRREVQWQPVGRGFVKLSVIDAKGRVDRVTVRLR